MGKGSRYGSASDEYDDGDCEGATGVFKTDR